MLPLYTNFFKRCVIFISSKPNGHEPTQNKKKKIRRLHHIGAPADPPARRVAPPYRRTHTQACTPLPPPPHSLSALPSSLVVFLLPDLLFLVFSFSSSSSIRAGPPPPRSKVICVMDAAELHFLNGRPLSPNSILPGRSSPVRLRLTACRRPVGLPTTLTQCQRQLQSLFSHCYLCDGHERSVASPNARVSQLHSPLVFLRQRSFNVRSFLCCCLSPALLVTVPHPSSCLAVLDPLLRMLHLTPRPSSWLLRSLIVCAALSWFDFGLLRYWLTLPPIAFVSHRSLRVSHHKSQH